MVWAYQYFVLNNIHSKFKTEEKILNVILHNIYCDKQTAPLESTAQ